MSHYSVKPVAEAAVTDDAIFISRDGLSRSRNFVNHIYDQFQYLADHPDVGRDASVYGKGLRVWADRRYKLYVYYTSDRSEVTIERVISMRQQQDKAFDE